MRGRRNAWILLSATIAIAGYALIFCQLRPRVFWANPDFAGFYRAGRMVNSGDAAKVYDLEAQRAYDRQLQPDILRLGQRMVTLPFLFAPFTLLLFAPLAHLPYATADALWFGVNVAAVLTSTLLLRAHFRLPDKIVAGAVLLTPFFLPVALAIMQGQTSLIFLLLVTVVIVALDAGRDVAAGILLALAAFKPQFAIAALVALLAARKFKALCAFAVTLLALLAASILQLGWLTVAAFPRAIAGFEQLPATIFQEHPEFMPNLRGLASALLPGYPKTALACLVVSASGMLLAALAGLFARYTRREPSLLFSLLLTITILTSYHCYLHDASLLVVVALLTSSYIVQQESTLNRAALILTIAAVFALPIALPFAAIGPVLAGGLLLLCGLLILEIHFAAPDSNKAEAAVARRSSSNFAASRAATWGTVSSRPAPSSPARRDS